MNPSSCKQSDVKNVRHSINKFTVNQWVKKLNASTNQCSPIKQFKPTQHQKQQNRPSRVSNFDTYAVANNPLLQQHQSVANESCIRRPNAILAQLGSPTKGLNDETPKLIKDFSPGLVGQEMGRILQADSKAFMDDVDFQIRGTLDDNGVQLIQEIHDIFKDVITQRPSVLQ